MVSLFCHLHHVTQNFTNLNNTDQISPDFANTHLFYNGDYDEHLPIPVYSGIKDFMGPEFILSTLLSLGRFSKEREILLNETQRGCFCNSKLIGEEDEPESLQSYLDQVMKYFDNNKLVLFPNGQLMIDFFIIQSGDLLDSAIINDEITISEMPEVQLLTLILVRDEFFEQF